MSRTIDINSININGLCKIGRHWIRTSDLCRVKAHLKELFTMYPCLKLLTGDAMFAQRPLLEAIQEYTVSVHKKNFFFEN